MSEESSSSSGSSDTTITKKNVVVVKSDTTPPVPPSADKDTNEDPSDTNDDETKSTKVEEEGGEKKKKKKRRKRKKKKKKKKMFEVSRLLYLNEENPRPDYFVENGQTFPPTKTVASLYKDGKFPKGELMRHPGDHNTFRVTDKEKRAMDRMANDMVQQVREASEVHRQVRSWAQTWIKPGIKLADMCEKIENMNRKLVGEQGLERGIGFPTGCSINHIAAHYTPNPGEEDVTLGKDDVMKIDFGTQIRGRIIDCAWTVAFNEKFDPLLNAVKDATNTGIKAAGIDVRLCDIGESIQEVMESYVPFSFFLFPRKQTNTHTHTPRVST